MRSLPLSRLNSLNPDSRLLKTVTILLRLVVGIVFIFSGFVKAVDPWGTLYKMTDYLSAMGLAIPVSLVLFATFLLCAVEFMLGVFILSGCFRRASIIVALAFMGIMLPLTLWTWIFDPVPDCGCFGEALIISNRATFWKNILLTLALIWLLKFNKNTLPLISPSVQWLAILATFAYILTIESIGYFYQPLIDFRPYKIGNFLLESSNTDVDAVPDMVFSYTKDGVTKDFTLNSLPDEEEGWEFLERKEIKKEDSTPASASTKSSFHVWNGDDEITPQIADSLQNGNGTLVLLIPTLSQVSIAQTWRINSLYEWAVKHSISMISIVAGSKEEIETWEDLSMPEYPIYTADDTDIKELARGNPAVVFLRDGKIIWKSTLQAIDVDDFQNPQTSANPMDLVFDSSRALRNFSLIYLSVMLLLIMISAGFRLPIRLRRT